MADFLDRIEIGQTGLKTGRIGIGSTFDAPRHAIENAFDRGINYLYWGTVRQPDFQLAMAHLAQKHRDQVILTIQSYSDDPSTITGEVEEAISTGGVDSYDFLLLGNRMTKPSEAYIEVFEKLRTRGLVRFISLSSHNRPLIPDFLAEYPNGLSPYELLMLRYNPVHRGAETDVFPHVTKQHRPTIASYTSTRWGHLLDPSKMPEGHDPVSARDCYRYALSNPAVDMIIAGPGSADQMDEAISALEQGPLDEEERQRIEHIGSHLYKQYAPQYPDAGDAEDVAAGRAAE